MYIEIQQFFYGAWKQISSEKFLLVVSISCKLINGFMWECICYAYGEKIPMDTQCNLMFQDSMENFTPLKCKEIFSKAK